MDGIKIDPLRENERGNANFEWQNFAEGNTKSSDICNTYSPLFPNSERNLEKVEHVTPIDIINSQYCEDFDWEDTSGFFTNYYPSSISSRFGYMGLTPLKFQNDKHVPQSKIKIKTQELKCIYEDLAKFIIVYQENNIFYSTGYTQPWQYKSIEKYTTGSNPWASCTPDAITKLLRATLFDRPKIAEGTYPTLENSRGAALYQWRPINVDGKTSTEQIQNLVNEVNILGVTITNPLFTGTGLKFPNGLVRYLKFLSILIFKLITLFFKLLTSNHPNIHTRIERDLGPGLFSL